MKSFLFIGVIGLLFFFSACILSKPGTALPENRINGNWELNFLSGTHLALDSLFPKQKPTLILNFPDSLATGNGGCNGYSSKVKVNVNKIRFGDPLSTMMYCEPGGEQVYFKALKSVTAFSLTGDTLTLNAGKIPVMRFSKK